MVGGTRAPELEEAANAILQEVPTAPPTHPISFASIKVGAQPRRCAAVDGGSSIVLNARTAGMYAVRAGYVVREPNDVHLLRITSKGWRTVTKRTTASVWEKVVEHHGWGLRIEAPKIETNRMVAQMMEAERGLAEFDAARRALHELHPGDLLLVDGSFDEEDRNAMLRESLLEWSQGCRVGVVGLSKDTGLSLGGILPFTLELEELATAQSLHAPWIAEVTDALGYQDAGFRVFGVQFDARATPYRLDVAGAAPEEAASFLLGLCNDPAYPGYPYPLARIHHRVHYESGEAIDLRRELESIVARRRGHRMSLRLFGQGRDVLELAN